MFFYVRYEYPLRAHSFFLIFAGSKLSEVFHRELCINGDNPVVCLYRGVNYRARFKSVLQMERLFWKHLGKKLFEYMLSDVTPKLWTFKKLRQILHTPTKLCHFSDVFLN